MGVRFQKSYIYKIPQFISALVASLSLYKWLHLGLLLKITCSIESLTNHISLGRENEETGEEAFLGPLQSLLGAGGSVWSSKRGVVASNHQKIYNPLGLGLPFNSFAGAVSQMNRLTFRHWSAAVLFPIKWWTLSSSTAYT